MKISDAWLLSLLSAITATSADPVAKSDLVFHLDAASQPSCANRPPLPPIHHLHAVDMIVNSAGKSDKLAVQWVTERRPVLISDGETAYLRFDSRDDFLSAIDEVKLTPEVTVFMLAAPKSNQGDFAPLPATAEAGKNDYTSGLNIDFGPAPSAELSVVNIESAGATGFEDMLVAGILNAADRPYGVFMYSQSAHASA